MNAPPPDMLFAREQYRMVHLQVFNWGTFGGLHDIPISERGFLFVGRSGTGKSTLLDAISALLVPPQWIDFNAAAREAERTGRDRNLVSYIRGAWAEQKNVGLGEIATQYLRPGTTWSALGLTYRNSIGQVVSLVQIFWLRGTGSASADARRHYLIFERAFDLRELEAFGDWNFDLRKLKQAFPEAFSRERFRPYGERFCHLLGIDSENALRLLHKTQSAKNLGDLNTFLRDFMLDKPDTFEAAERLVDEFGELNTAHLAVITARRQIETLAPARESHQEYVSLYEQRTLLEHQRSGVEAYREYRRIELLGEHIAAKQAESDGLEGLVHGRRSDRDNQKALLADLQQRHRELGGEQIERWEGEKSQLAMQRDNCLRKRSHAEAACRAMGWTLPDTPQGFAELAGLARTEVESWQSASSSGRRQLLDLEKAKEKAETEFTACVREVEALRRQPSNIPSEMLELRAHIAEAIGVGESALPFVGELLQVKPEEAPWQGSVERVLRGFALSLLVDDRTYPQLVAHLNATHLGRRLVYFRTGHIEYSADRPLSTNSMVLKLNVKAGTWSDWLKVELRRRFDYACVDSLQAFRAADRALTREGQVKHSRSRHEKDDRRAVDDRRNWVLGFDNRDKLALFEQQAHALAERIEKQHRAIEELEAREQNRATRLGHCQILTNLLWHEIDVAPLLDRIADLEQQIREVREGDQQLNELGAEIERQTKRVDAADEALREAELQLRGVLREIEDSRRKLAALEQDPLLVAPTPVQREALEVRFAASTAHLSLSNLDTVTTRVMKVLGEEIQTLEQMIAELVKSIEASFAQFIREWPADSDGIDATLYAAPDFFAKLSRLETDGLPAFEDRFFELLQNQSQQNLAALSAHLNNARKAILERMDLVNDSLAEVPFNQSGEQNSYLRIDVSDRQLAEVREFRQQIQETLRDAFGDDRELAESRFKALRSIVERLASQESEHRRWREAVLDVRQHVEFIGRELDEAGVELEIYRSGAGKSGGQRQKLATTCLAAALRYQLGGHERGAPMYAPVVLDEAFDKADNEFTTLAMNVFINFGFQMIVATPLKSVMTLEPFIGGACFIDISDRKHSGVLLIEYDETRSRLDLPEHTRREAVYETS